MCEYYKDAEQNRLNKLKTLQFNSKDSSPKINNSNIFSIVQEHKIRLGLIKKNLFSRPKSPAPVESEGRSSEILHLDTVIMPKSRSGRKNINRSFALHRPTKTAYDNPFVKTNLTRIDKDKEKERKTILRDKKRILSLYSSIMRARPRANQCRRDKTFYVQTINTYTE